MKMYATLFLVSLAAASALPAVSVPRECLKEVQEKYARRVLISRGKVLDPDTILREVLKQIDLKKCANVQFKVVIEDPLGSKTSNGNGSYTKEFANHVELIQNPIDNNPSQPQGVNPGEFNKENFYRSGNLFEQNRTIQNYPWTPRNGNSNDVGTEKVTFDKEREEPENRDKRSTYIDETAKKYVTTDEENKYFNREEEKEKPIYSDKLQDQNENYKASKVEEYVNSQEWTDEVNNHKSTEKYTDLYEELYNDKIEEEYIDNDDTKQKDNLTEVQNVSRYELSTQKYINSDKEYKNENKNQSINLNSYEEQNDDMYSDESNEDITDDNSGKHEDANKYHDDQTKANLDSDEVNKDISHSIFDKDTAKAIEGNGKSGDIQHETNMNSNSDETEMEDFVFNNKKKADVKSNTLEQKDVNSTELNNKGDSDKINKDNTDEINKDKNDETKQKTINTVETKTSESSLDKNEEKYSDELKNIYFGEAKTNNGMDTLEQYSTGKESKKNDAKFEEKDGNGFLSVVITIIDTVRGWFAGIIKIFSFIMNKTK